MCYDYQVIWPCQNQYPGSLIFNYPGDRVRARKAGESLGHTFRKILSKLSNPTSPKSPIFRDLFDEGMDKMDSYCFEKTMDHVATLSKEDQEMLKRASVASHTSMSRNSRNSTKLSNSDLATGLDQSMRNEMDSLIAQSLEDYKLPEEKNSLPKGTDRKGNKKNHMTDQEEGVVSAARNQREEAIDESRPRMPSSSLSKKLLKGLKKPSSIRVAECNIKVTIWAHSMGTWMLQNFFSGLRKEEFQQTRVQIE